MKHNTVSGATVDSYYNIKATNHCSKPRISFEYEGLTRIQMRQAIKSLGYAFRKIEVVDNQTGELIYDHYESAEIFIPAFSEAEAIDNFMQFMATC